MHIHTKFGIPTSKNIRDMLRTKYFLKLGQRSKPQWLEMVCDTPSSQDTFKHQIWNSCLTKIRKYAPDSMQFLENRSEVKFKVIVTQLWYATLCHPKMLSHTKFEIPTANTRSEVKFNSTVTQLWIATLPHPRMHNHTKFGTPSSNNNRDMLRTLLF